MYWKNDYTKFHFVDDASSDYNTLSDSSGHITLAPMELWGDDALVPIRQKDAKSMPKKSEM